MALISLKYARIENKNAILPGKTAPKIARHFAQPAIFENGTDMLYYEQPASRKQTR
jgi:hypothetical protein